MPILTLGQINPLKQLAQTMMLYTAVISRPVPAGKDKYGQPGQPLSYPTHPTYPLGVVCSWNMPAKEKEGMGLVITQDKAAQVDYYSLNMPWGTDIKITDRVESVVDQLGSAVQPGVLHYEIKDIVQRAAMVSVFIRAIR